MEGLTFDGKSNLYHSNCRKLHLCPPPTTPRLSHRGEQQIANRFRLLGKVGQVTYLLNSIILNCYSLFLCLILCKWHPKAMSCLFSVCSLIERNAISDVSPETGGVIASRNLQIVRRYTSVPVLPKLARKSGYWFRNVLSVNISFKIGNQNSKY